jgi:glucosylceramidase
MYKRLGAAAAVAMVLLAGLAACGRDETGDDPGRHYGLTTSSEILVTSEAGDRLSARENVSFTDGVATGTVIEIDPEAIRQTLVGIGSSFTESSAFVLAHLEPEARAEVMRNIYGEQGANFSLARTTIASTDFSVEGKYSYAPVAGDADLEHFSIDVDRDGFQRTAYPGIRDESFDLLPMIKEALAIKNDRHGRHGGSPQGRIRADLCRLPRQVPRCLRGRRRRHLGPDPGQRTPWQ